MLFQVNVKSNFLAFKEANNFSSDRKKEQEQGESPNSLSPAMTNMSLQPGLPVAGRKFLYIAFYLWFLL